MGSAATIRGRAWWSGGYGGAVTVGVQKTVRIQNRTVGVQNGTVGAQNGTERPVHPPTVGMLGQFAVLAGLAATVGLGPAGWLAGTGYALVCWGLLSQALARPAVRRWGPADTVTLARAILVGGVTALVADSLGGPGAGSVLVPVPVPVPALVALATVALLLDGVDGQVARRTGTCSRWGARFDMETDAFLVLVLSAFVAGTLGGWVLAVGIPRYAFGAAGLIWPWLREPVPERRSRKVVAATQGIALVVASAGVLPVPLAAGALGLLLALLGWSFGRDIGWLWRARHRVPVARVAVAR